MGKENIILGSIGIIIGITILAKTHKIVLTLIPIIVGLALIFFHKEEDIIEKRRDKK